MPIIRSAIKKMRQDKKRYRFNLKVKVAVKSAIKEFRKNPVEKEFAHVMSMIDTAAKKHVFHENKASRIKSRLSKLMKVAGEKANTSMGIAEKKEVLKKVAKKATEKKTTVKKTDTKKASPKKSTK